MGHPDTYSVEEAINEGWIRFEEINEDEASKLAKAFKIHAGEAEALLLAKNEISQLYWIRRTPEKPPKH